MLFISLLAKVPGISRNLTYICFEKLISELNIHYKINNNKKGVGVLARHTPVTDLTKNQETRENLTLLRLLAHILRSFSSVLKNLLFIAILRFIYNMMREIYNRSGDKQINPTERKGFLLYSHSFEFFILL